MDEKSLQLLEFPQIRENLANHTSFLPSRELALSLQPLTDYERISLLLSQSAEARRLLILEPGFAIGEVYDIRETVKLAALGKILEPQGLLEVQYTLAAFHYLRGRLARLAQEFPRLWKIAEGIVELRDLEKEIVACLMPDGQVRDAASSKLAKVRQQMKSVRSELLERLGGIIESPRWHKTIQEPLITERDGRYVIPIKVEFRKDVRGIVHDVSNTGATVFVEPWATIESGNTLRELEIEEKYEVERILRNLSGKVGIYAGEIVPSIALVAELDLALAKARYARKLNAVEPELMQSGGDGSEKTVLKLVDARHPLLAGKAVPLSVEIGQDFSILVITGPNTGGKTVALKTIGLLSLMAQAGLPIPAAAASRLPVFDHIFADIGDEQSIEQTLSTFSWHVTNIVRVINGVTSHSLVLLDELGTSTDPAEGSALARAILLHLLNRGTMTVATTHFSDLKAFAHTTPRLQNASLDFEPVTLAPTYHLTVGVPGGSNALATAARLGLSPEIVAEARSMLSRGSQELETLLSDLVGEKQNLQTLRQALEREQAGLAKHNLELENELKQLRSEEKQILREVRDTLVQEAADLHKDIRQTVTELRKEKSKEKVEQARRALAAVQEKLKSGTWAPLASEKVAEEKISAGDTVWLKEANLAATVLSVLEETRQAELQIGQAKLKVSLDSIEKVSTPSRTVYESAMVTRPVSKRKVPLELDLRGKRAEEVAGLLDGYLNEVAIGNMGKVRIIHGIGTGVVRQIVRELLATHPLVKSFRSGERGEGGDGATVVSLT